MNYLYSYPTKLVFDDENNRQPGDLAFDQEHDGRFVYLSGSQLSYPDGILIGTWNSDGTVPEGETIDPVYLEMRPVGNLSGEATPELRHHYFMGHAQRHMQTTPVEGTSPLYPADNQPIVLTMERYWDDTPGWEGWGWKATIEFSDPTRLPNARAIGIYDLDWSYLYTTGAFINTELDDGAWKWQTKNPVGKAAAEKEDLYYALLLGAAQEGSMTLPANKDRQQNYFWEADQVIPGGEAWVDVGQTVTVVYGTVVVPEDINLFPVGTAVRIGGVEYVVASIWAGQGFTTTPNADHSGNVGEVIWIWQ